MGKSIRRRFKSVTGVLTRRSMSISYSANRTRDTGFPFEASELKKKPRGSMSLDSKTVMRPLQSSQNGLLRTTLNSPSIHPLELPESLSETETQHTEIAFIFPVQSPSPHAAAIDQFIPEDQMLSPIIPFSDSILTESLIDFVVPQFLQQGTPLLKISKKRHKPIQFVFRLDADQGRIIWESKIQKFIAVENIKEIRTGQAALHHITQLQCTPVEDYLPRWLTLIYLGPSPSKARSKPNLSPLPLGSPKSNYSVHTYKTLHLVASSHLVIQLWERTLRSMVALRVSLTSGLGFGGGMNSDRIMEETRQALWERSFWTAAGENMRSRFGSNADWSVGEGDESLELSGAHEGQRLTFNEMRALCERLNVRMSEKEVRRLFNNADTYRQGSLDFEGFRRFGKLLKARPELDRLFKSLVQSNVEIADAVDDGFFHRQSSRGKDCSNMPFNIFRSFMREKQKSTLSEAELKDIFDRYSVELYGESTVEGYVRAFLGGCRCVELDIFDTDTGPQIFHGKTLTSKVSLRERFTAGSSARLSCPEELKGRILVKAKKLHSIDYIDSPPLSQTSSTSSRNTLQLGHPFDGITSSPSDTDAMFDLQNLSMSMRRSSEDDVDSDMLHKVRGRGKPDSSPPPSSYSPRRPIKKALASGHSSTSSVASSKTRMRMSPDLLSLLVYTVGVKYRGINKKEVYRSEEMFSLSENMANKMLKVGMIDLIKHTRGHLVRIYPKGTRVRSTNYQPHRYWSAGAQLVAINWQTVDLGYMINHAMFQRNGGCGYLLKPLPLRMPHKGLLSKQTQHYLELTIVSAQHLPAPKDASGKDVSESSPVNPYVQVTIHVPDWPTPPSVSANSIASGLVSANDAVSAVLSQGSGPPSPASGYFPTNPRFPRSTSYCTSVVKNNGFNPVWEENMRIPFTCVGDMKDLIYVNFAVRHTEREDVEPLAQFFASLGCLQHGYRHLPLHDSQMSQYLFSTLFVRIDIS
ncbi:PLC-like phosphodiesterase [Lentinula edodes]|uniref:Phosphoinositide phospholipase C n=1 Tax=Lentinula edodes TaxID=5353 RepID=A0A1Q3E5G1_LENED|nr:PLC-like phosphodiesterase [Lentinula edodes]